MLKLNLGCGEKKLDGYVNVDLFEAFTPDVILDLEEGVFPWGDNSVEEVLLEHVLEHLGQSTSSYLRIIQELYRVCANGAKIKITVPHPRHDNFLHDPTHVRPITAEHFGLFSKKRNEATKALGMAESKLAFALGVDFEIRKVTYTPDGRVRDVPTEELERRAAHENNIVEEIFIELEVLK